MNFKILQQKKGQALLEAIATLGLMLPCSLFLLLFFLNQMVSIAVDDAIETYFVCQLQNKNDCILKLKTDLQKLRLSQIQIVRHQENKPRYLLEIKAITSYNFSIHFERKLCRSLDIKLFSEAVCEKY
ncbi:MAG: hypothetical protein ACEQSR_12710 [Candidatus Methylacidiphilales bacterium]